MPALNEDSKRDSDTTAQDAVLNRIQQLEEKVNMQQSEINILREQLTKLSEMKDLERFMEGDGRVGWLKQRNLETNKDVVVCHYSYIESN